MISNKADNVGVVEMLELCVSSPREGLNLINQMSGDLDFEYCVLGRFRALAVLATEPFMESDVSPYSSTKELFNVSRTDTVDLCERALHELVKIEQGKIELSFLHRTEFEGVDNSGYDKGMADSICSILEAMRPTRVQEIRGRTKIKYLGQSRRGMSNEIDIASEIGHEAIQVIMDTLVEFPHLIGSVIPYAVDTKQNGTKLIHMKIFREVTNTKPISDPGIVLGVLTVSEDRSYVIH